MFGRLLRAGRTPPEDGAKPLTRLRKNVQIRRRTRSFTEQEEAFYAPGSCVLMLSGRLEPEKKGRRNPQFRLSLALRTTGNITMLPFQDGWPLASSSAMDRCQLPTRKTRSICECVVRSIVLSSGRVRSSWLGFQACQNERVCLIQPRLWSWCRTSWLKNGNTC